MKKRWAKLQPKDGETVLHCGHADAKPMRWFAYPNEVDFTRPDGSKGVAKFLAVCRDCWKAAGYDSDRLQARGDGRWLGDAPHIKELDEN